MIVHRVEPVDSLFRAEGALVLYERELVRLSPLGEEIFVAAQRPVGLEDLARHLAQVFGVPAGDPLEATGAAVRDLVARGVLREVVPNPPDEGNDRA